MYEDPGRSRLTCQLVTHVELLEEAKSEVRGGHIYSIWHLKIF